LKFEVWSLKFEVYFAMRIFTNIPLVKRNVAIGKYGFGAGMLLLVGAFVINLLALNRPNDVTLISYVFAAFLLGFALTSVGTIFQNRWGRRPDHGLEDALKGLDERYTLYNYRLGAAHVLTGPGGVVVLYPKYQYGPITVQKGKWLAPSMRRGFLGLFNNDPLGNPSAEAAYEIDALTKFLKKNAPEVEVAPQAVIVFMSPRAEVSAKESPVPALHVKQLKEHVRRLPKGSGLNATQIAELETKLGLRDAVTA
jgi:hypothetical protein